MNKYDLIKEKRAGTLLRGSRWVYICVCVILIAGAYMFPHPRVIRGEVEVGRTGVVNGFRGILKLPGVTGDMIRAGETVNVKLFRFPYQQYGILRGVVDTVYRRGEGYEAVVSLGDILETSFHKRLPDEEPLQGMGEIVVKERYFKF